MQSQVEDVLELLREGPVTPLRSWVELGVYRLAHSIWILRQRGHVIATTERQFTTSRGRQVTFAEYVLVEEKK